MMLRKKLEITLAAFVLGTGAAAYMLSRVGGETLDGLREGFISLAAGDLGARVSTGGRSRTAGLAAEFNAMASKLEERFRALEREVAEKTDDLKRADDRLVILEELKNEFISLASHELRSPLSSMKMGVATVAREMVGPLNDEQKTMLEITERNIDRLTRLTTDLLDLVKIEAGLLDLEIQESDVGELVREVVEAGAPVAAQKGLGLDVYLPPGPLEARCDRERMKQVLTNVVGNALNFTDAGEVSVSADRSGAELVVRVTDTGVGIPADALSTVFDKWPEAHSRTSSERRGSGLGLAICRGIVEAHGGNIKAESELEKGTAITLTVPVRGPDEQE